MLDVNMLVAIFRKMSTLLHTNKSLLLEKMKHNWMMMIEKDISFGRVLVFYPM